MLKLLPISLSRKQNIKKFCICSCCREAVKPLAELQVNVDYLFVKVCLFIMRQLVL